MIMFWLKIAQISEIVSQNIGIFIKSALLPEGRWVDFSKTVQRYTVYNAPTKNLQNEFRSPILRKHLPIAPSFVLRFSDA